MKFRYASIISLIIAGILYVGCMAPAAAQNPTCPTRPNGDNTNACASTAFVQNSLVVIPVQPILDQLCTTSYAFPLYNGTDWVCSTSSAPLAAVLNGTLNLAPLAGSVQKAISSVQTLSGGPLSGAIQSNLIEGNASAVIRGNGAPGTSTAPNWSLVQISGSVSTGYDTQNNSGVQVDGQAYGLSVGMVANNDLTTYSDLIGISGGTYTGSLTPNARLYGGAFAATVGAGGQSSTLIGAEIAASIASGGVAPDRIAVNAISYDVARATTFDAAFGVSGGNPGGQFKYALGLFTKGGTLADALATTGSIIYAQSAQTVDSIINVPLLDVSSYVLNTKNAKLTGSGILDLGTTTVDGGLVLSGGSGANLAFVSQFNGSPLWVQGATSSVWYLSAVGYGSNAIQVAHSTNLVTLPNGLVVNTSFSSTVALTAPSFIPNSASVPSNGMYLPASNTLGWAINSAAEVQLTASALSPAVSGGNALGTTSLPWANAFLSAGGKVDWGNGAATLAESSGNITLTVAAGKTINLRGGSVSGALASFFTGSSAAMSVEFGRSSVSSFIAVPEFATQYWASSATDDFIIRASGGGRVALVTGYSSAGAYLDTSDNFVVGGAVQTVVTTVGSLGSCASGNKGARKFVTDANSTTFNGTATAGGSNNVPVVCNGTNWVIGSLPANDNDNLRKAA